MLRAYEHKAYRTCNTQRKHTIQRAHRTWAADSSTPGAHHTAHTKQDANPLRQYSGASIPLPISEGNLVLVGQLWYASESKPIPFILTMSFVVGPTTLEYCASPPLQIN